VLSRSCCECVLFLDQDISHCVIAWISPKIFLKYAGLLSTTMQSLKLMDSKTVSKNDSMDQGLLVCLRCSHLMALLILAQSSFEITPYPVGSRSSMNTLSSKVCIVPFILFLG